MRNPNEVATILAATMERFMAGGKVGTRRGRLSGVNIKRIAGREILTPSFMGEIVCDLREFGYGLVTLDTGGYAIFEIKPFEGAPIFNPLQFLTVKEKANLDTDKFTLTSYLANVHSGVTEAYDNETLG